MSKPKPAKPDVDPTPAVRVRDIRKTFGKLEVLKGVNLDIKRGEFFSLLGPSGCGKTTLLRMIGGFEDPTSGDIQIDGNAVVGLAPYARPTNMIFQNLALFPHLTVFENVAFALRLRKVSSGEIKKRVETALDMVKLAGYGPRMVDQMSGGQRQRIAMARALVNDPSVLLLDEPLGALDLQLRIHMQQELRRLQRGLGNTFVFVTHDQGEAMSMSDRIAVMNAGDIVQVGTPEDIYERPATRFVANFVGHANIFEGRVSALRDGIAHVDCDGTVIEAPFDGRLDDGQSVGIAIRYERIGLADPGSARIRGVVADRSFLGDAVRIQIQREDGLMLNADVATGGDVVIPNSGEPIGITWRTRDVRLLPA